MKNVRLYRKSIVSILVASALSIGLSGCFTTGLLEGGVSNTTYRENRLLLNDTLMAIGVPEAGSKSDVADNTVALFGQQKTYVLVKGGADLLHIAQAFNENRQLDAQRLETSDGKSLYLDGDTVWGTVAFVYRSNPSEDMERNGAAQSLEALGFEKTSAGNYRKTITVEAAVKPAVDLSKVTLPSFQKPRMLAFYEPNSKAKTTKPNIGRILLTPLAVAADVVTSPFQLLGLAFISYVMKGMH